MCSYIHNVFIILNVLNTYIYVIYNMYKMLIVKETVAINLKESEWGLERAGGKRHRRD